MFFFLLGDKLCTRVDKTLTCSGFDFGTAHFNLVAE